MLLTNSNQARSSSKKTGVIVTFATLLVLSSVLLIEEGFAPFAYQPSRFSTSAITTHQDPLEEINNESLGVSIRGPHAFTDFIY